MVTLYNKMSFVNINVHTNGAFSLRGATRLVTAWLGQVRFAFPPQFSATLEWAGLFTCRYSCAASTAVTSS